MPKLKKLKFRCTVHKDGRRKTAERHLFPQNRQLSVIQGASASSISNSNVDVGLTLPSNHAEPVEHVEESPNSVEAVNLGDKVSQHYATKQKEVEAWQCRREQLLAYHVNNLAPSGQCCVECFTSDPQDIVRCLECGPLYQGCEACVVNAHRHRPFHSLEKWQVRLLSLMNVMNIIMIMVLQLRSLDNL